eukprot:3306127-Alexandrium_andersonii.AAC.1
MHDCFKRSELVQPKMQTCFTQSELELRGSKNGLNIDPRSVPPEGCLLHRCSALTPNVATKLF